MMVSEKVIWAAMLKIIGLLLDLKPFQIIEWDSQKCYLSKPPSVVVIFDLLFILDALCACCTKKLVMILPASVAYSGR